jgi:hypothetical protein
VEGLRLLPWTQELNRRSPGWLPNCEDCMRTRTQESRQMIGCGYEPPPPENKRPYLSLWNGGSLPNYPGPKSTVCPGYSTNLPETIEAARARLHWSKGELSAFTRGEPSEALVIGIEILEGAVNELQSWGAKSRADGGGAG